jgi:hypothetical protein
MTLNSIIGLGVNCADGLRVDGMPSFRTKREFDLDEGNRKRHVDEQACRDDRDVETS